jgi:hypothetical protein
MTRNARSKSLLWMFISLFLSAGWLLGQGQMTGRKYMQWYENKYQAGEGGGYTPDEMVPVLQAKDKKDYRTVVRLADELIKRDPSLFYSPNYANWVKSEAYIERGAAKLALTGNERDELADKAEAALLGNISAATSISRKMMDQLQNPDSVKILEQCLRIAAELGDAESASMLGWDLWPNTLSDRERAYWSLVGLGVDASMGGERTDKNVHNAFARAGDSGVQQAIHEYSPLGGLTPGDPARGLPGRGVLATMFTDALLRREYAFNYGKRAPKTKAAESPSTLEMFRYLSAFADVVGRAKAYLLVPGTRKFDDPAMISLDSAEIGRQLSPGDDVFVRCGFLTHVARLYKIDREAGTLSFVDGLFEYWQPSHNSCITTFDLTPFKLGGFLARVSLREILPMIQGVVTFRDRTRLGAAAGTSEKYITLDQFERSEFFKFFHIREVIDEPARPDGTIIRYMTGAYQDQIFLTVHADGQYRVRDVDLTLRRGWLGKGKQTNPLANDIAKSFLAALTPDASAAPVQPLAREIWGNRGSADNPSETKSAPRPRSSSLFRSGVAAAMEVYRGDRPSESIDLPTGKLTVENTTDLYDIPVFNVSVRTVIEGN